MMHKEFQSSSSLLLYILEGVCVRDRDSGRHWHPVSVKIRSIQSAGRVGSPRRSPESLPCWSPQTRSPHHPCLVGGWGGIQRQQKKRGVREKQGSVGLAMAWCITSQQADWLPGPPEPIPEPPAPQTRALRQQESPWRSSSSRRVSPQERPLLPAGETRGKHRAGG